MTARIDRLWPQPSGDLSDDEILDTYAFPLDRTWLRMNFVSSLDGAATRAGVSGALGGDADRRVFALLRYLADVVLVGAGTVRDEGYGAMLLGEDAVAWRSAHGLAPQPTFAILSRSLRLDHSSPVFTAAPVRPIVYTVADSPADRRAALESVADVVITGASEVDPLRVREDLSARGHTRIHSEGGPSLFGAFLAAAAVDELCVTIAPTVEAGDASRIATSSQATPTAMTLASLLKSGSELLARYQRGTT